MGNSGRILTLDTILSATTFFVRKWSPELTRSQSRDLLRFVLCRLYDQGRGKLVGTHLTLAQDTLARKLGLSRQWVGILLARLAQAGWITYSAPWVAAGMRGSTVIGIGRQMKRLLIMLAKSRPRKTPTNSAAQSRWQFSPLPREKILSFIHSHEEKPLPLAIFKKLPLLKHWLERGQQLTE